MLLRQRKREFGFVLFAAGFWAMVMVVIALFSFLSPRYRNRGCLSRLFYGFGGVVGIFIGAMTSGLFFDEVVNSWQGGVIVGLMFLGCVGGVMSAASVTAWLEKHAEESQGNDDRATCSEKYAEERD